MYGNTVISTRTGDLSLVFPAANSTRTGTGVVQPADLTNPPVAVSTAGSEVGLIEMSPDGSYSANAVAFFPFGTDAASQTFLFAVFGWDVLRGDQRNILDLWHPSLLASFTCTLSAATGLAHTRVDNTQFYAGTAVVLAGNANVSCEAVSPTGDLAATLRVDAVGCRYITVQAWRNGSAASANALWRRV